MYAISLMRMYNLMELGMADWGNKSKGYVMDTFRTIFVTIIFITIWLITFFAISSLAPDVPEATGSIKASNTFDLHSERIGRTAPYVYGGIIAGLGLGIGIASIANKVIKKIQQR